VEEFFSLKTKKVSGIAWNGEKCGKKNPTKIPPQKTRVSGIFLLKKKKFPELPEMARTSIRKIKQKFPRGGVSSNKNKKLPELPEMGRTSIVKIWLKFPQKNGFGGFGDHVTQFVVCIFQVGSPKISTLG
jgi:hypothetical protein